MRYIQQKSVEYDPERKVLNISLFLKKLRVLTEPSAFSGPGIYCRKDDGLAGPSYCIVPSGFGCRWHAGSQVACHRYGNRRWEHQPVSFSVFQLALEIMISVLQLLSLTFASTCYRCPPRAESAEGDWKTKGRSKPREAFRIRSSAGRGIDYSFSPGFVLIMFGYPWYVFRIRSLSY